jgi:hypothetical protein
LWTLKLEWQLPGLSPRLWWLRGQSGQNVRRFDMDGLYKNIAEKKARIKAGSGEKMRKPGTKGAPTKAAFVASAKTAKPAKMAKKK